tara:strand:- start:3057 stop:3263 length:207 start_codon:yes stop_codon:yes gene_type:complete
MAIKTKMTTKSGTPQIKDCSQFKAFSQQKKACKLANQEIINKQKAKNKLINQKGKTLAKEERKKRRYM